ncbi:MAG: hypothetical protein IT369_05070 [Candidatus Latescibacteria bacterium]|nr:hypothetical protein [Candidatus Latescibacterota bacterium]
MTPRQQLLAVYSGQTPDQVPYMLDLSHWFYWQRRLPWDLSASYEEPEGALIDYHRQVGAGFYLPNLGAFYAAQFDDTVKATTTKETHQGAAQIRWRLETPLGSIERARRWEEQTYAWGISEWGIRSERDLEIFAWAMSRRTFAPRWEKYQAWVDYVGDRGVVYLPAGYSAMGYLMHLWMGVEQVVYAAADIPAALSRAVAAVNANNLELIDLLCTSPAEVVLLGDNFSSDMQPPSFFAAWSEAFYAEAIRRLHRAGKKVAVHIDGRLRGALAMFARIGADCGDAITPQPMGDLSPRQCREEAGTDFILSGGVSPELWLPQTPLPVFERKVIEWLELGRLSPRLIAAAGDQVPPGADEARIHRMRELVEEHGRY